MILTRSSSWGDIEGFSIYCSMEFFLCYSQSVTREPGGWGGGVNHTPTGTRFAGRMASEKDSDAVHLDREREKENER